MARICNLTASSFSEGNVRQDVFNVSVPDSPTLVPIQPSLGTERLDLSQPSSQQDYGKSGCESEESVHDVSASSLEFLAWVAGLLTAGACIPQQVLNLTRLDRVLRGTCRACESGAVWFTACEGSVRCKRTFTRCRILLVAGGCRCV